MILVVVQPNGEIRYLYDESVDLSIKLCEVFLCPFYFGSRAETWIELVGSHVVPSAPGLQVL